jgi:hypothetical protein
MLILDLEHVPHPEHTALLALAVDAMEHPADLALALGLSAHGGAASVPGWGESLHDLLTGRRAPASSLTLPRLVLEALPWCLAQAPTVGSEDAALRLQAAARLVRAHAREECAEPRCAVCAQTLSIAAK